MPKNSSILFNDLLLGKKKKKTKKTKKTKENKRHTENLILLLLNIRINKILENN